MSTLSRAISDKQTMLFDKDERALYIIDGTTIYQTVEEVEQLVTNGVAKKFSKENLQALQSAFSQIVLLGGPIT
jgi:phage/plasmid primase-like uncharacterized protein